MNYLFIYCLELLWQSQNEVVYNGTFMRLSSFIDQKHFIREKCQLKQFIENNIMTKIPQMLLPYVSFPTGCDYSKYK